MKTRFDHTCPIFRVSCRPYLIASIGFAILDFPFLIVKAAFTWNQQPWVPAAALIAASALFSLAHLGTARNMVTWARKRYELGLMGFGYPWEVKGLLDVPSTFACTKMGSVRCQNPLLGTYLSFLMLLADILKDNGLGKE